VDKAPIFKVKEKSHPLSTAWFVINGSPVMDTEAAAIEEMHRKMFPNLTTLISIAELGIK